MFGFGQPCIVARHWCLNAQRHSRIWDSVCGRYRELRHLPDCTAGCPISSHDEDFDSLHDEDFDNVTAAVAVQFNFNQ